MRNFLGLFTYERIERQGDQSIFINCTFLKNSNTRKVGDKVSNITVVLKISGWGDNEGDDFFGEALAL